MVTFNVFKGSQNGKITQSSTTREVGPDEVLIKVTHSGVCGTDEHLLHHDIVLGHEGSGTIEVSHYSLLAFLEIARLILSSKSALLSQPSLMVIALAGDTSNHPAETASNVS